MTHGVMVRDKDLSVAQYNEYANHYQRMYGSTPLPAIVVNGLIIEPRPALYPTEKKKNDAVQN